MRLILKDYERPSILLQETGYLYPIIKIDELFYDNVKVQHDDITYIPSERNYEYFPEANTVIKINENREGYFDFNKSLIDIGANVGCYSLKTNFKRVYAFEPNIYIYHLLCVNLIMQNKFNIVKTFNAMLSDKNEEIEYDGAHTFLNDQPNTFFNDFTSEEDPTRYLKFIKTHTLDEYNCQNVGLIKIDVEGMEEKVLKGGIGTIIRNNYPPILFECWDVGSNGMTKEKHNSLQSFFENLNYEILWYWGDYETHLAIHK